MMNQAWLSALKQYLPQESGDTDNMSLGVVKAIWINAESTAGGLAKARYSPLQAGHQPKPREVLAAGLTLKDEHVFC